eukprot:365623-Chlamydomonas_euryale.AAC.5
MPPCVISTGCPVCLHVGVPMVAEFKKKIDAAKSAAAKTVGKLNPFKGASGSARPGWPDVRSIRSVELVPKRQLTVSERHALRSLLLRRNSR